VVRAIRNRGHFAARLDPLGRSLGPLREGYEAMETSVPEDGADIAALLDGIRNDTLFLRGRRVTPAQYLGLHDVDRDRKFYFGNELASLDPRGKGQRKQWWTLNEVLTRLRTIYCGTLTAEFHHIASARKKAWLQATLEGETEGKGHWVSARDRRQVLRRCVLVTPVPVRPRSRGARRS
jgi:2-oxoglutarate dehydrogenase E1 component